MGMGLLFLFTLVWRLFERGTDDFVRDATASGFVLAYAPLMGAFAALIAASPDGADRVLTFIVLSIASDIGGYAAGVLFGKHPMAPAISPKKSWEGFAGSVTLQVVLGSLMFVYLLDSDWWKGAIVGAADDDHRDARATSSSRRSSATWASRTCPTCCPAMAGSWTASTA